MKKRTKKKILKYTKKTFQFLFTLLIIWPVKGLWYLGKKSYAVARKHDLENDLEKNPKNGIIKSEAKYDALREIQNETGTLESFEKKILKNKSTIGLILGARGTGKSAIGMRLLENFKVKTNKKVYALGFKAGSLPNWIKCIKQVDDVQNNSVILVDEGGIEFSSRNTMSNANKFLSELLLIARHKDLSVMFITQNSSNLEINVIRQADYLILKPSSLLQKDFERKKIKNIYDKTEKNFDNLKKEVGLTYIYADNYRGFVANSLPTFWSDGVSKGYA